MLTVSRHRLAIAAALSILCAACQLAAPPDNDGRPSRARDPVGALHRDLAWDEAHGGHTLARHVGLSDADLRARLATEAIAAASTFDDRDTAARVVAAALEASRAQIDRWSRRKGQRPNLVVYFRGDASEPIGRSLRRGDARPRVCWAARIVLRWDQSEGEFFVLTAYPEGQR